MSNSKNLLNPEYYFNGIINDTFPEGETKLSYHIKLFESLRREIRVVPLTEMIDMRNFFESLNRCLHNVLDDYDYDITNIKKLWDEVKSYRYRVRDQETKTVNNLLHNNFEILFLLIQEKENNRILNEKLQKLETSSEKTLDVIINKLTERVKTLEKTNSHFAFESPI